MIRTRPMVWFIVMFAIGLLVVQIVGGGYYPIAMVNGSWILSKDFRTAQKGFATYFLQFLNTYDAKNADVMKTQFASQDIAATTLTSLIEEQLVHAELQTELGGDLMTTIQNRIEKYDSDPELRDAAQTISGLSFGDFRTLMLVPKAEEDILSGRLSLKGEKLDAWLLAAKKTSDVKVFSRELYWDGEGVKSH